MFPPDWSPQTRQVLQAVTPQAPNSLRGRSSPEPSPVCHSGASRITRFSNVRTFSRPAELSSEVLGQDHLRASVHGGCPALTSMHPPV